MDFTCNPCANTAQTRAHVTQSSRLILLEQMFSEDLEPDAQSYGHLEAQVFVFSMGQKNIHL